MAEGGALINLGELSKPATVLIEKVSDAVGGIAKPWQMKRVAKAEAEAAIIKARARIQLSEVEERGLIRMVREEGQRQENIESITAKAIPNLNEDANPENIEKDWLVHFFDHCRLTSDEEMQSLWSNILSGEANRCGSFSKRTVSLVHSLEKTDANLFTNLCTFVWELIPDYLVVIFDCEHDIYNKNGINYVTLNHLDTLGLITFNNVTGFTAQKDLNRVLLRYFDRLIVMEFTSGANKLEIGKVLLTEAGKELVRVSGAKPSNDYHLHVVDEWVKKGYCLYSPLIS